MAHTTCRPANFIYAEYVFACRIISRILRPPKCCFHLFFSFFLGNAASYRRPRSESRIRPAPLCARVVITERKKHPQEPNETKLRLSSQSPHYRGSADSVHTLQQAVAPSPAIAEFGGGGLNRAWCFDRTPCCLPGKTAQPAPPAADRGSCLLIIHSVRALRLELRFAAVSLGISPLPLITVLRRHCCSSGFLA